MKAKPAIVIAFEKVLPPAVRETPQQYADRVIQSSVARDSVLYVVAACYEVPLEEVATLAEGTLFLADEPGISPPAEERVNAGKAKFLELLKQRATQSFQLPENLAA